MTNQLLLIDSRPAWRLDQATRAQGLQGVANARAVLRSIEENGPRPPTRPHPELTARRSEQPTLPLADAA